MGARKAPDVRRRSHKSTAGKMNRWSQAVTTQSNALDLEDKVFTRTARQIALSLKRSADRSTRRKGSPFQSAMSMLNFYENRAGRNLPAARKHAIHEAKDELRKLYGREPKRPLSHGKAVARPRERRLGRRNAPRKSPEH